MDRPPLSISNGFWGELLIWSYLLQEVFYREPVHNLHQDLQMW